MEKAKKDRTVARSNFTRNFNSLSSMINDSAEKVIVEEQFNKFKGCWGKLETAHDAFIEATDIDIESDKDGLYRGSECEVRRSCENIFFLP